MSVINMGEVLYILLKHLGEQRAFQYVQALQHAVTMIEADARRTIEAATLKHQYKLDYADSFAAALALALDSARPVRTERAPSLHLGRHLHRSNE
jgi:predicted nucleic acid-binding protein